MKIYLYSLIFLFVFIPSKAFSLDKDRPVKHIVGAEVKVSETADDEVIIYYNLEKETDDYILKLELESGFQSNNEKFKIKVEVEF